MGERRLNPQRFAYTPHLIPPNSLPLSSKKGTAGKSTALRQHFDQIYSFALCPLPFALYPLASTLCPLPSCPLPSCPLPFALYPLALLPLPLLTARDTALLQLLHKKLF
jgi:hypothetical protein